MPEPASPTPPPTPPAAAADAADAVAVPTIVILGAGAVGIAFGSALLLKPGVARVVFIGRPHVGAALAAHGLHGCRGVDQPAVRIPPDRYAVYTCVADFEAAEPGVVPAAAVLSTKRLATAKLVPDVAHWGARVPIVTMQNGIMMDKDIHALMPEARVALAMCPFNVVAVAPGDYRPMSAGHWTLDASEAGRLLARLLGANDVAATVCRDMGPVMNGKLIVNLHNAVSALSGLEMKDEYGQRWTRVLIAQCYAEAMAVYRAHHMKYTTSFPVPLWLLRYLLLLPNVLFRPLWALVARAVPGARSSMYDDFQHKRQTEIDYFQGAIIQLAEKKGIDVPVCRRLYAAVKYYEAQRLGIVRRTPETLFAPVEAS